MYIIDTNKWEIYYSFINSALINVIQCFLKMSDVYILCKISSIVYYTCLPMYNPYIIRRKIWEAGRIFQNIFVREEPQSLREREGTNKVLPFHRCQMQMRQFITHSRAHGRDISTVVRDPGPPSPVGNPWAQMEAHSQGSSNP